MKFDLGAARSQGSGGGDRRRSRFSDETAWDPYFQPDPQYAISKVYGLAEKGGDHLPQVDAIGGSAAGIYLNNRVKVASLFRGVPPMYSPGG
jgi:hypothetical protein